MRIAYISLDPGIAPDGTKGASVHIQEMVRAMRALGNEVTLFSPRIESESNFMVPLTPIGKGDAHQREERQIRSNAEIRDRLEIHGPFDLVYERYSLFGAAAMEFARERGIGGILEVNAPLIDEQLEHRTLVLREQAQDATKRAVDAATTVAVVSSAIRPYVTFRSRNGNVIVVPNGVSPERFPADIQAAIPYSGFTYTFLGSLKPWHGIEFLPAIHAAVRAAMPNARLLVIGDGPMKELLAGIEGCECVGAVEPDKIAGYLRSADAGIAPYPYRNPFYFSPLKIVEYMAAGLPVVASDIGDIPEIVRDGIDGYLVTPEDVDVFSSRLISLARDPHLRTVMGESARTRALGTMSWESIAQRLISSVKGSAMA